MNKDINYPIKYAVLELKERGGYIVGYKNITQGFIVSKCYVIGSSIEYYCDGTSKIFHQIVFPYSDISTFKNSNNYNIGTRDYPKYDACNKVYPVNIVCELFDSYELAKETAIKKNNEFKKNLMMNIPVPKDYIFSNKSEKEQYITLETKFKKNINICNLFEQQVLDATNDMIISKEKSFVKILKPSKI